MQDFKNKQKIFTSISWASKTSIFLPLKSGVWVPGQSERKACKYRPHWYFQLLKNSHCIVILSYNKSKQGSNTPSNMMGIWFQHFLSLMSDIDVYLSLHLVLHVFYYLSSTCISIFTDGIPWYLGCVMKIPLSY